MTVYAMTSAGDTVIYKHPISIEISEDLYSAGSIHCTLAIQNIPEDFKSIRVEQEGVLLFWGMIDKQTVSISEKGFLLTLAGRDLSGILLDNEAKPVVYDTVTLNDIYKNHVSPYGIGKKISQNPSYRKTFTVSKGMSEFEVVSKFCRAVGIGLPFIDMNGKLDIHRLDTQIHFGKNGIPIVGCELITSRYKPLSEIIMSNHYDMNYSISVKNTADLGKEVVRKRYRRLSMLSESEQYDEVQKILAQSVYGSKECSVVVAGICTVALGSLAQVAFGELQLADFVVCEKEVLVKDTGIYTEFRLVPQNDIY